MSPEPEEPRRGLPSDDLEDEGGIEAGVLQSDPPGAEALASHAATWWPQIGSVKLSATWPASSSRWSM